jgi:hypothetical protein
MIDPLARMSNRRKGAASRCFPYWAFIDTVAPRELDDFLSHPRTSRASRTADTGLRVCPRCKIRMKSST